MNQQIQQLIIEIKKAIKGKDEVICKVIMVILASGHILLEDNPGLGKTTLAKSLAKAMCLGEDRIQFTPDTMPSDIVGYSILNKETNKMQFTKGPVSVSYTHLTLPTNSLV